MQGDFEVALAVMAGEVPSASVDSGAVTTPCVRRFLSSLRTQEVGGADIAALIRHVLRRESELRGRSADAVCVQDAMWSPSPELWAAHGVSARPTTKGKCRLQARPWCPVWLPDAAAVVPEAAAFRHESRRNLDAAPGDPFLSSVNRNAYLSVGQKEAVRVTLTAPPGSTVVVNLPTGHGKSLCGHIPGVLPTAYGRSGGVTVVVVPTVALCIDQAESIRALVGHDGAYHSGSGDLVAARNRDIRRRIVDGTQRIVFTSPEALVTGSLRASIYEAARRGYLRLLVIDEAHMVSQWGDGFRPAFQELSGLRNALLREVPEPAFRTLLLSATLTQACLDTLRTLFGSPGPMKTVSAVQLRPEPSYWAAYCHTRTEQEARVLDAVHNLPRPLILYTTEVADAEAWYQRLADHGYRRVAVMTGRTGSDEREAIVRRWADRELDIVVATSAFGLGVDQQDVRAVIHACVPETLDRLYQEVGRGGRDGNASVSLILYTQRDLETAGSLSQKRLISVELGLKRWERMFRTKDETPVREGAYRVHLDVAPGFDERYIDMVNDTSMEWNANTLTLMCRAGLIELNDEAPPTYSPEDGQPPVPTTNTRVVGILDPAHLRVERWAERVAPYRERAAAEQRRMTGLLREFLGMRRCAGLILADAYRISNAAGSEIVGDVPIAHACGGCGHCRRNGTAPHAVSAPRPVVPWAPSGTVGDRLRALLGGEQMLAVTYPAADQSEELAREWCKVILWAVNQGLTYLVAPHETLVRIGAREPRLAQMPFFWDNTYDKRHVLPIPTMVIQPEAVTKGGMTHWLRMARASASLPSPHILLFANTTADPVRPDRKVLDVIACPCMSIAELKARENL